MQVALDPVPEPMPVGLTVRADITAGEASHALLVPRAAVAWRGAQAVVRRAAGGETPVQTGLADETRVEIVSGLAEGDEVLLP